MSLRFADLNPLGRAIIITVAALTFGVAAISFATSYGALYAYARDTGLYSERLTRLWPLLLDGAFIVAQLAAILAGILRGSRGWPILTMLLTGALTVWFNLQHAGSDPGRRLAAALPPVLMMLAFEIDIQIVKWVMTALGKPLGPIAPPPTDAMLPGTVWRSDGLDWNVPPRGLAGALATGDRWCQLRQATTFRKTHRTGKPDLPDGKGPDPAGVTKRQRIEEYLDRLAPEQLRNLTVREITSDLQGEGLEVTERYVKHVLDQRRPTPTVPAAGEWPPQAPPMTGTEPRHQRPEAACDRCPTPTASHPTTWKPKRPSSAPSSPPDGCWPRSPPWLRKLTSTGQPTGPSGEPSSGWPTAVSRPTPSPCSGSWTVSASWPTSAAARSSTPSLRPSPPWPTPAGTPSWSPRPPGAGG